MTEEQAFLNGPVAQSVSAPPCHGGGRGFKSRQGRGVESLSTRTGSFPGQSENSFGPVAQLVERSTENRKVTGSTPVGTTGPSRSFYIAGVLSLLTCPGSWRCRVHQH